MTRWIEHNRPTIDSTDLHSILRPLKKGWVAEGAEVQLFEQVIKKYLSRKHSKAVSSGSAALHLALLALGIKKGDEVILSTYACTALLNAVLYVGAIPKIADISEKNLGLCPQSARKLLSSKTKAILVHHTFGFPANIQKIKALGVPVIEDCAQALGTWIGQKPAGFFGDISICSFYATKMITSGYGGMILTDNPKWISTIRDLTHYDQRRDYKIRFNYCLSDINAALGVSQFKKLPAYLNKRKKIATAYIAALRNKSLFYWSGGPGESPNFYRFVCGGLSAWRSLARLFEKRRIHVINPLEPFQLLHRYLEVPSKAFPVAEAVSRSLVSVPIYPSLTDSEIKRVCRCIEEL